MMKTRYRENFECQDGVVLFRGEIVGISGFSAPRSAPKAVAKIGKHTFIALGETLEECSAILERSFASISDE